MGADLNLNDLFAAFASSQDAERVRDAFYAVQSRADAVPVTDDTRPAALDLWLQFFAHLDPYLDRKWDPADGPELSVQPPISDGVIYPAGASPSALKDPAARARYEQALAERDEKTRRYDLQAQLHRFEERALESLKDLLSASPPAQRSELSARIRQAPLEDERKQSLLALLR